MSDSKTTVVPQQVSELWLLRFPSGGFVQSTEGRGGCLNAWATEADAMEDREHFAQLYEESYRNAVPVRFPAVEPKPATKEFWALRLPDGEFYDFGGSIMTFASKDEAVEFAEDFPPLDYAVAVLFRQVGTDATA